MRGNMPCWPKIYAIFGTVTERDFWEKSKARKHIQINAMLRCGFFPKDTLGDGRKIEVRLEKILNNKCFILESVCPKTRFALWSFPVIQKRIGVADFGDSSKNDSWNSMIFWFLAPINKRSSTKWIYRKYFWKCEVMDATLSYCAKNEILVNVTEMLQNKNEKFEATKKCIKSSRAKYIIHTNLVMNQIIWR